VDIYVLRAVVNGYVEADRRKRVSSTTDRALVERSAMST
jgi:hypothetical protein